MFNAGILYRTEVTTLCLQLSIRTELKTLLALIAHAIIFSFISLPKGLDAQSAKTSKIILVTST